MGSRENPLASPSVQKQLRSYVRRVGAAHGRPATTL